MGIQSHSTSCPRHQTGKEYTLLRWHKIMINNKWAASWTKTWLCAQWRLRSTWAHMPFCWFCHEAAQISNFALLCTASLLMSGLTDHFHASCILAISVFMYWRAKSLYPHLPSGPVHPYQLDESIYNLRGVPDVLFHFYSISNRYSC